MTEFSNIILKDLVQIWDELDSRILNMNIFRIKNRKKFKKKVRLALFKIWKIHLTTIKYTFKLSKEFTKEPFLTPKFQYWNINNTFISQPKVWNLYLRLYTPAYTYLTMHTRRNIFINNYWYNSIQIKYMQNIILWYVKAVINCAYKKVFINLKLAYKLLKYTHSLRKHKIKLNYFGNTNKLYTNKLYTNKLYTNKLYTNKLYTNKWNGLWLIQLRNKILFYTKAYQFCKLFSMTSRLWLNKYQALQHKKQWIKYKKQYWRKVITPKLLKTRFRFRPGYSILWRKARKTLRKVYKINSKYQHLLTRRLNLIYKYSAFHQILLHHYTLKTAFISIYMAYNPLDYTTVLKTGSIMVNGIMPKNDMMQLYVGDYIQMAVSWITFFYFINRYKYLVKPTKAVWFQWRRLYFKHRKKTFFKLYHQLCENFYLKFSKTNKYMQQYEIDYMVGSAVFLSPLLYWWETNQLSLTFEPLFDKKMYNWKYIT